MIYVCLLCASSMKMKCVWMDSSWWKMEVWIFIMCSNSSAFFSICSERDLIRSDPELE